MGLKLFESIDNVGQSIDKFEFRVVVNENLVEKKIYFSPDNGIIYGLEAKLEDGEDLIFEGDLSRNWKMIKPEKIENKSEILSIKVGSKEGSYRMSSFKIAVKYLQGPNES